MRDLVSVLLPYKDVDATLEEAIASLLSERDARLELLAIDDGSRDASAAIARRLANRDQRVRLLASEGRGLVAALELGRREAQGAWIARMDGDDVAMPGRLQFQLSFMKERPEVVALGTRVEAFPSEAVGEGLRRYVEWQNALVTAEDHARELFVEAPLCHPSTLLRRDALDAAGGWRDVPWPEDYDLWLRLSAGGGALAKLSQTLLRWRHREGRATFAHARYGLDRIREGKAAFLAPILRATKRAIAIWGAGPTGRRLARALEPHGVRASFFIDIDPRKIDGQARGAPIVAPGALDRSDAFVVVAVGARGARELIRAELARRGRREVLDFLCAA